MKNSEVKKRESKTHAWIYFYFMMTLWRNLSDETVSHFFDLVLWNKSSKWSESLRCLCSVNTDSGLSLLIQAERRSFRSPVPFFWNIYQSGRVTAGGGRDGNLERISRSLIFVYTSENVRQRLLWAFWLWPFSNLHSPKDAATRCCAVTQRKLTQGIVLPPCECLWLLVKVCGTCRISYIYPLPNICTSGINSIQPDAL